MITRFAMFEGTVKPGCTDAFRAAVHDQLIPLWTQFAGSAGVRVMFGEDRDEGAPEFPLILAIDYPDADAMAQALACDARSKSRDVTGEITRQYFDGRIHHHVTDMHDFPVK